MRVQAAPGYAIGIPIEVSEKSISGLILNHIADDYLRARIVVVGDDELTATGIIPFPFDEGDIVLYQREDSTVRIDGHNAVILHRTDVVAALWEDDDDTDE